MALKPVLRMKVDELFLRWLSDPETQEVLHENLRQIIHGEQITQPSPRSSMSFRTSSPRHRPLSPTLATSSSKLPSPRSPRRPLVTKNSHKNSLSSSSDVKVRLLVFFKDMCAQMCFYGCGLGPFFKSKKVKVIP